MALTKCKECGSEVSKNAEACPKCGAPIKKKSNPYGCGTLILLSILGLLVIGYFATEDQTHTSYSRSTSTVNTTPVTPSKDVRYAHKTINIREGAGKKHKVVDQLKRGSSIEVVSVENKWAKISLYGVHKGYVYEPLLKNSPLPSLEIASWNWSADPDFGTRGSIIWNVEVRNNTDRYIERAKVEFSTYDSSGELITSDSTYVMGLSPGGTATDKSYATYYGREKKGRVRIVR